MRSITYVEALNEALHQILEDDPDAFLIGQGVNSPWYVGASCAGLLERFGPARIIDTPVSENAVTGVAVGAALAGKRPILEHPRMDFMYYAFDPIANQAANWHYMMGSQLSVPLTIWGIINRGGEQGAQHSQATHAMLAHLPGLKVVMPSTPYDVKGLLRAAVHDGNPVLLVDDRWLYRFTGDVPEDRYTVPIGRGAVRREGSDVTVVATSYMVHVALEAAKGLREDGIEAEVIDPLTLKPMDAPLILSSVRKTRRLVVADGGWRSFGAAAEVMALVGESDLIGRLKAPMARVTLPDAPAPASRALEKHYFKTSDDIKQAARAQMGE